MSALTRGLNMGIYKTNNTSYTRTDGKRSMAVQMGQIARDAGASYRADAPLEDVAACLSSPSY
jgi:hypothetical protein